MKKMITISLLLCCFYIVGHAQMTTLPPRYQTSLITGNQYINCIQTNASLLLSFNQSLGEITVAVWNNKKVYSEKVSASSDKTLTIPTSGWDNATYAICITNRIGMVIATFDVLIQN